MKKEPNFDTETALTQTEAGRIVTLLRGRGIRIRYRELIGFSPIDAAKITTAVKNKLTPAKLAELAGRDVLREVPEVNDG